MHDYQVEGADFIKANPYCACFVDLGLGKTVMSLTAITDLLWSDPRIKKVLVIAPLKVANMTWPDEIRNWYHTCHLDYAVLTGDEASRLHGLRQKVKIYIINRENVEWLVNTVGRRWDFDMVVIDEAANFKDSTTNRFKALAKVRPRIRRVVELTATTVSESYLGLFAMIARSSGQLSPEAGAIILGVLVAYALGGLFNSLLLDHREGMMFAMFMGLLLAWHPPQGRETTNLENAAA